MLVENPASGWLTAAVEEARPEVEAAFAEAVEQTAVTIPAPSTDPMEDILRAYEHIEQVAPPEPVKVTREQWAALRAQSPTYPEYARPNLLSGVPVVLVDDPADATFPPDGAEFPQVAPKDPQVGFVRRWLDKLRRHP
jgi:hypothetical protein